MHDFQYANGALHCESVPLEKIAQEVGTPFYCYSQNTLVRHFKVYEEAFKDVNHLICYAVKANSNLAIINELVKAGAGCDIVSGGELFRALKAGCDPKKIVYAGVGKTEEEIEYALKSGILMFNAESSQELFAIDAVAARLGLKAGVALRVNPDVDPKTHPYISTGLKKNKFGISIDGALEEYRLAAQMKNIQLIGVHQHIGSQITQVSPFVDAVERLLAFVEKLKGININIKYIDIGGGLGITYKDESPPLPAELAKEIVPQLKKSGCTIVMEPGRNIVGNAGVLVSRVLYTKKNEGKTFFVVDAGMNDLVRPAMYQAHQGIQPVDHAVADRPKLEADVVGPICESGDFLAKDRILPEFKKGELLAVMSAGAYGFSMASNYNSRRRVAEVLVKGSAYHVVRARETWEDLIRGEKTIG
ncbi:MAG: diaminopimelate decarboxylase [Nitrospinae bacterium]|nr:diaminopimelate decarboxylase [Nitrospinota bacterium]